MLQAFGVARIGRDAELRDTSGGDAVCNVSLAFTYDNRKDENGKRPTQWIEGVLWAKRAEALAPYLLKGQQVAVELRGVHIETFTDREGVEKSKLVGTIAEIDLVGNAPERAEEPRPRAPAPRPAAPAPAPRRAPTGFADMDDDIPF